MKRIACTFLALIMCLSLFSTQAFAAKDKSVKTGLKAEKVSSFNVNSSDELSLANTLSPIIIAEDKDGAIRFLDSKGKNINDSRYDCVDPTFLLSWSMADALLWTALGQADVLLVGTATEERAVYKVGLIDVDGTEYFPCEYDKITMYDEGCCALFKLGKQDDMTVIEELALFDLSTKQAYPFEVPEELTGSDLYLFKCNLSEDGYVQLGGGIAWGEMNFYIFSPEGEIVFEETDSSALDFYGNISKHWDYSGYFSLDDAFYDDNGELISVTSAIINSVEPELGIMVFYDNSGYGLMDLEENILLEPEYDNIAFTGEYGYVKKEEKYGLINREGKLLTELVYDELELSACGVTMALKDGRVALLNSEGEEITDFIFDEDTLSRGVSDYGSCIVSQDGKIGMLDENGEYILKPELDADDVYFEEALSLIKEYGDDSNTYYMRSGAVLTAEHLNTTDNADLFVTESNNKVSLVDYGGNVLVKGGENSEYFAMDGSPYVLGLAGKTVNVYELSSK